MRFISIYKPGRAASGPPNPKAMEELTKMIEKLSREGKFLGTEGLMPASHDALVKIDGGKYAVTDGPFAEAKEAIGGYAIFEVESKAEVIQYAKEFLKIMGEGSCEIHGLMDMDSPGACGGEPAVASHGAQAQ